MESPLDKAPCAILRFADNGSITYVNETLVSLVGRPAAELVGQKVEVLLTIPSRIFYQTHFFPLLKLHGHAEEIFLTLRDASGAEVPVLTNARREVVDGGHITCALMPIRRRRKYEDELLQAKKEAEEALRQGEPLVQIKRELEQNVYELDRKISSLEQRNDELSRVSRILSHDLQEPIRKILLFADLLNREDEMAAPERRKLYLERIVAAGGRMDRVVKTLQEYLSIDDVDAGPGMVALSDVLHRARKQLAAANEHRELVLVSDPLPVVEGFRYQLELLFFHLLDNAQKFRKPDETPTVRVSSEVLKRNSFSAVKGRYRYVDFVKIRVEDNGIGFDQKYREYVFDLLTKLNVETPGLGIGLAIARKIVSNHFGTITAEPYPGQGTGFIITLPLRF